MSIIESRWTIFCTNVLLTFTKALVDVSYGRFLIEFTRSFPSAKVALLQWMGSIVAASGTILTWKVLIMIALFGYKKSLLIGTLLGTLGLLLTSLARNEFQLMVSYGIFAYGAVFISSVGMFLIAVNFPPSDRYHIFTTSFRLTVYPLAATATPITSMIIERLNWRLTYIIYGAIILTLGLFVSYIFGKYKDVEEKDKDNVFCLSTSTKSVRMKIIISATSLALAAVCRALFINLPVYILPKHSLTLGLSVEQGTTLVSYFGLAELCTHITVVILADAIFKNKLLHLQTFCCFCAVFVTLFLGYNARTYDQLVLYVILLGILTGALAVGRYATCGEALHGCYTNELFSLSSFFWGVGFLIGMTLSGLIFDLTKSYHNVFVLMAVMQILGVLFYSIVIAIRINLHSFLVEKNN